MSHEALCRGSLCLGVCPSHAILLRQTICRHLHRSRPETVPAASPSRRRAQTWCGLFVAPCALNYSSGRSVSWRTGGGRCNRLRFRLFRACGSASASNLLFLATKDYSDRFLATRWRYEPVRSRSFDPRLLSAFTRCIRQRHTPCRGLSFGIRL
jgi:hypothetical protein